jgi:hypothetical protein
MAKGRYDKYIDLEFYHNGEYLNYEGYFDDLDGSMQCNKCEKVLNKGHVFTLKDGRENTANYESRAFGNECIKYVVGAGFGK